MVGAFRAQVTRRALSKREQALVFTLSLLLVFSTWAIALRDFWALCVAAALAIAALGIGISRPATPQLPDPLGRTSGMRRLLQFPVFWLGLLLLVYIAIQALNPAWVYQQDPLHWELAPVPHISWLPSGTGTPLLPNQDSGMPHTNAWYYVILLGMGWATACAAWAGITRRLSCQILAWVLAGNAAVLTLVAVAMRLTGADKVLWFYEVPGFFWGSFSYRNWAASFLGLSAAVAFGLALNYGREHLFAARGRNPVALVALLAVLALTGAVLSGSRAGLIWSVGLAAIAGLPAFLLVRRTDPSGGTAVPAVLIAVLILGFVVQVVATAHPKGLPDGIARLLRHEDQSAMGRLLLYEKSMVLTQRNPVFGVGAGGYRYHFATVQARDPDFMAQDRRFGWTFVRDAHNDWLQYWIELGWLGGSILLSMPLYWLVHYLRLRFWRSPFSLMCAAGVSLAALHALGEFIWQNGACILLFSTVVVIGALWREIEHRGQMEPKPATPG
jgi:O-antigen ligase